MRLLVIAPHADDEVLGCGGLIARRVKEGHNVDIVVMTLSDVEKQEVGKVSARTRLEEFHHSCRILGAKPLPIIIEGYENRLDLVSMKEIISSLDLVLRSEYYTQVFYPYASHHQDHRIVNEACFAALRPGSLSAQHQPKLIALYEYPYTGWIPAGGSIPGGRYYLNISDWLEVKLNALAIYKSQYRAAPHLISFEAVATLARMRGIESGYEYAELFYLLRMDEV